MKPKKPKMGKMKPKTRRKLKKSKLRYILGGNDGFALFVAFTVKLLRGSTCWDDVLDDVSTNSNEIKKYIEKYNIVKDKHIVSDEHLRKTVLNFLDIPGLASLPSHSPEKAELFNRFIDLLDSLRKEIERFQSYKNIKFNRKNIELFHEYARGSCDP
ncbi:MAG: hypothetical protein JRD02_11175 [Deltaproteobacteria bacterium]|nr:hypothetical protein [Deltaproteobacteria bacterium]